MKYIIIGMLSFSACTTVNIKETKYVQGCYDGLMLIGNRCKYYDATCEDEIKASCALMEESWLEAE